MTKAIAPPHDIEAEEATLGSLLIDHDATTNVAPILRPGDFYNHQNRDIYEAILSLSEKRVEVDFLTLSAELERLNHNVDSTYLAALLDVVPTAMHAEEYARQVQEMAIRREVERIASKMVRGARDKGVDINETLRIAESELLATHRGQADDGNSLDLFNRLYDQITEWAENPVKPGETRYLSTGIRPFDDATGGLEPGFYLFGGRASMGKTSLILQMVANIVLRGERVLLFTLEMSREKLALRMACARARVTTDSIKRGTAAPEEHYRVTQALDEFRSSPLDIRYSGTFSPHDIRTMVHKEMTKGDIAAVVVDGLWLMASNVKAENRNLQLAAISREMKLLADTTNLPLLTTHQLSRACEQRENKRPLLSDLRDSGALEQNSDKVFMIYRDGYYMTDEQRAASPDKANIIEIINRKNRDGFVGDTVKMFWQEKFACLEELAPKSLRVY